MGGCHIFSPLLGITGAFITGSTTISNVVFETSQLETAKLLHLNPIVLLSLQLNGAGIGKAICLFNMLPALVGDYWQEFWDSGCLPSYKSLYWSNAYPPWLNQVGKRIMWWFLQRIPDGSGSSHTIR